MLIEAEPRGERQVGADPDEHGAEPPVVPVEVVLLHPGSLELQMIAVGLFAADIDEDAGPLAGLEDHDDLVGLGAAQVGRDKLVPAPLGSCYDRCAPLLRAVQHPVVVLGRDVARSTSRLTG